MVQTQILAFYNGGRDCSLPPFICLWFKSRFRRRLFCTGSVIRSLHPCIFQKNPIQFSRCRGAALPIPTEARLPMKTKTTPLLLWGKRLLVYVLGLFIMAVGVVCSSRSALGVPP